MRTHTRVIGYNQADNGTLHVHVNCQLNPCVRPDETLTIVLCFGAFLLLNISHLQEHSVVLCRVGNLRDVPGVKLYCVRGAYDLAHVQKGKK